jgi:DNA mismatch repair protein MutS
MFQSILFESASVTVSPDPPDCFGDLNLDQIVEAVTAGREAYELKPFFYTALRQPRSIGYRQEVMRDLEMPLLFERIGAFAEAVREIRRRLSRAAKLRDPHQADRWVLDAASLYCQAVLALHETLQSVPTKSRGFAAFAGYLSGYVQAPAFRALLSETKALEAELSALRYCVQLNGGTGTVQKYESETDYSADVAAAFAKFKQGAATDYRPKFTDTLELDHVEERILAGVAQLHPELFAKLSRYAAAHRNFPDAILLRFDRETQFYMAYLDFIAPLRGAGLKFCYPGVSDRSKAVRVREGFDLALAHKLAADGGTVVTNDFFLQGNERVIVVSGPNQGGKTTFARGFGQAHFLAALGCPVPGAEARLFLFDRILTHFGRQESMETLAGNLQDDLERIRDILAEATPDSILIVNELFASTTLEDAVSLSKRIMAEIVRRGCLCVWVTFLDEMASFSEATVSMVSTITPEDPSRRTYKILRKPAAGMSYAISIAEKYRLNYDALKGRLHR